MDMGTGMGGAITAVAATTTVGIGATIMAGGIITIGGDFDLVRSWRLSSMIWRQLQLRLLPGLRSTPGRFPLCPVIDQGRMAAQYVAIFGKHDGMVPYGSSHTATASRT